MVGLWLDSIAPAAPSPSTADERVFLRGLFIDDARHGWDAINYPVFHTVTHAINISLRLLQKADAAFSLPQFRLSLFSTFFTRI